MTERQSSVEMLVAGLVLVVVRTAAGSVADTAGTWKPSQGKTCRSFPVAAHRTAATEEFR